MSRREDLPEYDEADELRAHEHALDPAHPGVLDPDPPGWRQGEPHPAHGPAHLLPRDADGRIPIYYYCSPEEIVRGQFTPPNLKKERRTRQDGFSPERQRYFIEMLAATASVGAAAAVTGISRNCAYRLRNAPHAHAFRAAWDAALRVSVGVLADTAFERAVEGVEEPIVWRGETMGYRRRYDNRLIMFLLRVRDPAAYAPLAELGQWQQVRPVENASETLDAALARLDGAEPDPVAPEMDLLRSSYRPAEAPALAAAPDRPALPVSEKGV
ncbi:hypothetical protein [Sphingomonas jatrophae]|uniref:Uncharacterized protein n=1 Tax=Sphingomonas jatrophae TaxID=1166337 RepID=A0A1I6LAR3_9SPHN|nr:hypothetical protein [Sphingomonas jatrophae]SFS00547.1 hypothetical protein SAMN05192580_2518 [Sphingomonas jatrophae]